VARNNELEIGHAPTQARKNLHLPTGMKVKVDLIDHHNAAVLDESPSGRGRLADVIQQVADPADLRRANLRGPAGSRQ
jgi:hypothetical protein